MAPFGFIFACMLLAMGLGFIKLPGLETPGSQAAVTPIQGSCPVNRIVYEDQYSVGELQKIFGPPIRESRANLVDATFVGSTIPVHKLVAPCLEAVGEEVTAYNLGFRPLSDRGGIWCIREEDGQIGDGSYHVYGAACDINPNSNNYYKPIPSPEIPYVAYPGCPDSGAVINTAKCYDMPPEYVTSFKNHGFAWGGDQWRTIRDYMHFEWHGANPDGTIPNLGGGGGGPVGGNSDCASILKSFVTRYDATVEVRDLSGDKSCSINASISPPQASLYKLFVAKFLYAERASGKLSFSKNVSLSDHRDRLTENNRDRISFLYGSGGEKLPNQLTIEKCLQNALIYSDNVCGSALLEYAQRAGGSLEGGSAGVTASAVADLMVQVAQNKIPGAQEIESTLRKQYHDKKIPAGLPASANVANKTGELHGSNYSHDAAIIRSGTHVYVLVVLTHLDPDSASTNPAIADLSRQIYKSEAGG